MPTDCALAMGTLLHALPASQPDSTIAGMPASVFGNIVSGVVGSVITLGGVLLSNWHSRRLKRDELGHDTTQRDREREMALRREVFLPTVEAALAMQASIGTLVNLAVPAAVALDKFTAGNATFVKVAAIGTQETVTACQTLSSALGRGFWELSLRRGGLENFQNQLADLDRNTAIHEGLRDSWIKVQQEFVAKGEKDAEVWQAARAHFTHHMNEITKALTERSRIVSERQKAHGEMVRIMLKHVETIGPSFPPALFAMRREMQLPLDEAAFLERFNKLRDDQLAVVKATIDPA
ncbi:hypothetical protein CJU94_40590 (plasmid) [Paraburkholderia aromaticivorans]|uniref:Uncharacterized protein n=2 Tax=Paraburkholderia aromaticivorans TaxID=2026199 RepID=A0A248W161_9BURK|nr:hypothetical protein CJU94_40590 [Paraburkholderia aromaticivorans]